MNLPVRWDAGWYLNITTGGYRWSRRLEEHKYQNIAFFPGFPIAIYLVGRLFGGAINAHVAAGVLISHLAFLWALVYLYRLARDLTGDAHRARDALLLTATYPYAVFYGAIYTESLFLLGAVAAIYEFRAQRWSRVVAWGVMIGLTRPNGFMLALTLGALAIAQGLWTRKDVAMRTKIVSLAATASPILGVALYLRLHRRANRQPVPVVGAARRLGTYVHRRHTVRALRRIRRRARIRVLRAVFSLRADERRCRRFCAGRDDSCRSSSRISVRDFHPVEHRSAAAGRRLHFDRPCDVDDVPDLHVDGAARVAANDRAGRGRIRHAAGSRGGAVLYVAAVPLTSRARTPRTPSVTDDTDDTDSEVSATSSSLEHAAA